MILAGVNATKTMNFMIFDLYITPSGFNEIEYGRFAIIMAPLTGFSVLCFAFCVSRFHLYI